MFNLISKNWELFWTLIKFVLIEIRAFFDIGTLSKYRLHIVSNYVRRLSIYLTVCQKIQSVQKSLGATYLQLERAIREGIRSPIKVYAVKLKIGIITMNNCELIYADDTVFLAKV